VGPRAGLDAVAKRGKIPAPGKNQTPVVQPVAYALIKYSHNNICDYKISRNDFIIQ